MDEKQSKRRDIAKRDESDPPQKTLYLIPGNPTDQDIEDLLDVMLPHTKGESTLPKKKD